MRKVLISSGAKDFEKPFVVDIGGKNISFLEKEVSCKEGVVAQIIDLLIQNEWEKFLKEDFDIQRLNKKSEDVARFIKELVRKGPYSFASNDGNIPQIFPDELHLDEREKLVDRRLNSRATAIVNCNTLFIFDDCQLSKNSENFIKRIAEEMYHLIPVRRNLAFISEKTSSVTNPLFDMFLQELFMLTSQANFDGGRRLYEKEGPLLIEGRTGTGKSLAAKLIAAKINRSFTAINLSAISTSLIESRVRGFKKGVFTDAKQDTPGWLEKAHNGVLFLDELQSAPLDVQTQLLDFMSPISNKVQVARIGDESNPQVFDVKIIMAINESSKDLVLNGKLREDFFHRIRDLIDFKSLDVVFRECRDSDNLISRLLTMYRWKSFRIDSVALQGNMLEDHLFFNPDSSLIEIIKNASWVGNYRQFERFAYDMFWEKENGMSLNEAASMLIDLDAKRFSLKSVKQEDEKSAEGHIAGVIEEELMANDFNIAKSLPAFAPYKLKSRAALRRFMQRHLSKFSPSFQKDSKIIHFLK